MDTGQKSINPDVFGNDLGTVLFDFDGTLVFHEPDSFDMISAYCAEIGQSLSPRAQRLGRRRRHEYFVDPLIREQISGRPADEFWLHLNRHLLEAICIEGDLDAMAEAVTGRLRDTAFTYRCPPSGRRILAELRARGYSLGLVTNRSNVERFHELLDELGLWSYFDMILASGEVGIPKPEPTIFFAALDRLGATASEALYVGDNYWADVVGARRAGILPILVDPHKLFPEADCLVLEQVDELLGWLP
jgi:HAD superfamily hydrolase (TIGR01509 family)